MPTPAASRRARIVAAAEGLLIAKGLHGWSMDQVAREAGCAKGLVHYHFGTRAALLAAIAGELARDQITRRTAALRRRGTRALDDLWLLMQEDAARGASRAWLELGLESAAEIREAMGFAAGELSAFGVACGEALEFPPVREDRATTLLLVLDALEAALARGAKKEAAREAYDRIWLAMLG